MALRFDQLFVVELRNGQITHLQAYVPCGPPGVAGLLTRLTRGVWRLQGKRQGGLKSEVQHCTRGKRGIDRNQPQYDTESTFIQTAGVA